MTYLSRYRDLFCTDWRHLFSNFVFALLTILCCAANSFTEQRELKTKDSGKTDAILLLDASGSMLLTDPQRLRDEGAKLFLQFLKAGDRLGIVEFSNNAKIIRPLGDFEPSKADEISKQISLIQSIGQYTDLHAGVNQALQILDKEGRKDAAQVVILMSDGKMDPDPIVGNANSLSNKLFNELLPQAKIDGVRVHTLSFSENADKDILAQIAASTEAMSMYTPDSDRIHESYAKLFLVVKKPQVLPLAAGKSFRIDGDVQEATFYINRENGGEISLTMPSGKRAIAGSSDEHVKWYRGQKFDVITIISPEPGEWEISGLTTQDGFATLLTNLKLVTDWTTTVSAEEDTLLQARLYESEKPVVLPEMTGSVKYGFSVIPTDRVSEPVIKEVLRDDGKEGDKIADDGIFSALINLSESGDYMLKVLATAPTFDRFQQIPFRVKPRLLNLSVATHAGKSEASHGGSHEESAHGANHENGHSEEGSHAPSGEHADDTKHQADAKGDKEYFIAKLSPEVKELKNVEVKIVAIDKDRTRYNIEMHETEDPLVYEVNTSLLPHEGSYEVQATLAGQTKSRKVVKASSKLINYLHKGSTKEVTVIEKDKEIANPKEVKDVPPSVTIFLIVITVWNVILAAVGMVLFKKVGTGPTVSVPEFESIDPIKKVIASLKEKLSVTVVDLDDPIFSGKASGSDLNIDTAKSEGAGQAADSSSAAPEGSVTDSSSDSTDSEIEGMSSSEVATEEPNAES